MNEWMNERMSEWMNEIMDEFTIAWMNEWLNKRMNGRFRDCTSSFHCLWSAKNCSAVTPSNSEAAMSTCIWICLNDGRFRALAFQHIFMSSLKPSGQLVGTGRCKELLPTPQMIAEESTSLYGVSPVSNSHNTTPNDLRQGGGGWANTYDFSIVWF